MRIAHVTYSFWPIRGGADAYLAELWRALHDGGHEQTVFQAASPDRDVFLEGGESCQDSLSGEGVSPGFPGLRVMEWPVSLNWSAGRRFWALTAQAYRHREELYGFDRVIAHYPNYALPILDHPGLIGLSHGVTWDCVPGIASQVKRGIAQAAFRRARAYVANDTFFLREMGLPVASQTCEYEAVQPRRWYLPNAVDTTRFHPAPGVPVEKVILLPRNFYRNRGIHLGIQAFSCLAAELPDTRLRIVGGDGDRGYRQECEALAANLGVGGRVEFAGAVPWREMVIEYQRAAVTWIPSLCGEGTSLSALESMACGTPVVSSRAGGLPDLPCLHADLTPDAFADATFDLMARRDAVAVRQREAVTLRFNLERWSEAWRGVV